MTFKSAVQPLCRTCGQPIKKRTTLHLFGAQRYSNNGYSVEHTEEAHSKAEAQRYLNERIVSVRSGYKCISVTTWDGESYEDPYFHSGECARIFAKFALDHGFGVQTQKYADAIRHQNRRTRR